MIITHQIKQSHKKKDQDDDYAYLKKKNYDPYEHMIEQYEISNKNLFKKMFSKASTTRIHGYTSAALMKKYFTRVPILKPHEPALHKGGSSVKLPPIGFEHNETINESKSVKKGQRKRFVAHSLV